MGVVLVRLMLGKGGAGVARLVWATPRRTARRARRCIVRRGFGVVVRGCEDCVRLVNSAAVKNGAYQRWLFN
jgi:hypothetical protein